MHEIWIITGIAAMYLPLLLSPGLNFVLITQSAASRTRQHSVSIALGVSTGSMVWACLAAAGLGAVLARFEILRLGIYAVGGVYLLYTAWKLWPSRRYQQPTSVPAYDAAPDRTPSKFPHLVRAYWHGLLTNMTNPKPLVFYTTVFAGLFTPNLMLWVKCASVLTIFTLSLSWHMVLATVFSSPRIQRHYAMASVWINRLSSGVLLAFGVHLLHTVATI
jgi:threonine/homoserine/homoserine lactone efflux protein